MEKQNSNRRIEQLRNSMMVDIRMLWEEGYSLTAQAEYFRNAPDCNKEYEASEIEAMIEELI